MYVAENITLWEVKSTNTVLDKVLSICVMRCMEGEKGTWDDQGGGAGLVRASRIDLSYNSSEPSPGPMFASLQQKSCHPGG